MKKRLLSTLLILCLVTALFSGFSVTASADNETIQHTLQRGETVIGVCKTLGVDFYANYKWITETNKITNYGNLKPGMVLTLPKPGTRPSLNPAAKPSEKPSTPAPNPGGNVTPGNSTGLKLLGQDFVSSYLITHIMQRGETVSGVCNSLGINFTANSAAIQKINNIQNYNKIYVGRAILLPSVSAPASGSCIAVVAHKVVSGDAMYNICNSYGIDYSSNLKMMQSLNNRNDNLANIKVGQIIYLPVPTVITPGGGNSGNSGNGGNGGNAGGSVQPSQPGGNSGNSGNAGNTNPSDGKTYKISALTTNHGSYEVQVGGKRVNEAKSGTTVSVVATPAWDHQLGYITVTSGGKNIPVSNGQFVMPTGNVKVSVTFVSKDEYKVLRDVTSNGQFSCLVNGTAIDKAAAGQKVTIKAEPKYGYELDSVSVIIDTNHGVSVNPNDNSFIMPDEDVTVRVSFKRAAAHKITANAPAEGGYYEVRINGRVVSEANSGETVRVVAVPDKNSGYKFAGTTVKTVSGRDIPVNGGKFIMPEEDIIINVKFDKNVYTVNTQQASNGTLSIDKSKASAGDTVNVTATPNKGYELVSITVNGNAISGTSFTMPVGDATVSATFKASSYNINNTSIASKVSVDKSSATMGETVTISVDPDTSEKVKNVSVFYGTTYISTTTVAENSKYTFVMPAENVEVYVSFETVPAAPAE